MSDEEQKKVFTKNLLYYVDRSGKTQKEIANAIGVSPQTFNTWCQGIAIPRMGKVQLLADYFHIKKSDLLETKKSVERYIPEIIRFNNLQKIFYELNDIGQEMLVEFAITIKKTHSIPLTNAAHADNYSVAPEELKKQEEDIMDDENF